MPKLNKEEKEILESFERSEWKSVDKAEIKKYQGYAKATFKQDNEVKICMSRKDIEEIQKKAIEEGVTYQTLISSILHKYVSGRLVDKESFVRRLKA